MTVTADDFGERERLRPARPRRRGDSTDEAAAPDLRASMQELHELTWTVVDHLTDLREGAAAVRSDINSFRRDPEDERVQAELLQELSRRIEYFAARLDSVHELLADVAGRLVDLDLDGRLRAIESSAADLREAVGALVDLPVTMESRERAAAVRHQAVLTAMEAVAARLPAASNDEAGAVSPEPAKRKPAKAKTAAAAPRRKPAATAAEGDGGRKPAVKRTPPAPRRPRATGQRESP